ncbi:hypothetical protein TESG_08487 [Trichophyton tonsurans CBS 112818]|uniref:Uncharacterized protein n=2 Tax=Trichophyton TaxID=5550 RepID=F2PIC7_TRIEC|nr:hypothetical protein TESG_08487 [Trichophyton tonsurans CBS 112818]EGE01689.1 hypothetical protein TEQG_00734 [Trichophyton equinum CBS 127.97]
MGADEREAQCAQGAEARGIPVLIKRQRGRFSIRKQPDSKSERLVSLGPPVRSTASVCGVPASQPERERRQIVRILLCTSPAKRSISGLATKKDPPCKIFMLARR